MSYSQPPIKILGVSILEMLRCLSEVTIDICSYWACIASCDPSPLIL